jgi:hypothetical protein
VLLGILVPMLLARPIAAAFGAEPRSDERAQVARIAVVATLVAPLAVGAMRLIAPIERTDGASAPISALGAVPPELRLKPVLNAYAFGGYLIFEHVRPFIDARVELYGDTMLSLYDRLERGDREALETTLERYAIAWTIFPPASPIVAALDREPGWRRLYSDTRAVVQVRAPEARTTGVSGD